MMRIVFSVTNDLTHDRRMDRICGTLQSHGYDVTLIGRRLPNSSELALKNYHRHRIKCIFQKGPLFYTEFNLRLLFYLLRHPADIFGACDLDTILGVLLAVKLRRRKGIFDAHEHFAEVPEVERRPWIRNVWHTLGKWCIPHFDLRYTVGGSLARVLGATYHAQFAVVRNAPPLEQIPILPFHARDRTIVYIGALNEGRGLEYAIEAMEYLPGFRLVLIGEGDLSAPLREMVAQRALGSRIEFMGWVAPEQLHTAIRAALFGLNVLEKRSQSYYFSLSNKFFDYMHAGVPSLNMAFPEYIAILNEQQTGICLEELSALNIADRVRALAADSDTMNLMIESCEQARRSYCWQQEEQHLLSLVASLK